MNSKNDPRNQIGAYGCAVTAGNLIGYKEQTAVNADYANYQDRVQIYNTVQGTWSQGPRLLTRRRDHRCTLVGVGGRMVTHAK